MREVDSVAHEGAVVKAARSGEAERQAAFFDVDGNRYSVDAIKNPPQHARVEVEQVIRRIEETGISPDDEIIDFGAGSGRLSIPLLQRGHSVLAVDVSDGSLAALQTLADAMNLQGLQTAKDIPSNGTHRAIVGADILHHVDMDEYLPRLYNALAPGGRAVFSEPGALNPTWYVYLPITCDWSVERGVTTCTSWNLERKLRDHGFREISITGLGLLPRPFFLWTPSLGRLNDWIGDRWPARIFAYRYIVQATK